MTAVVPSLDHASYSDYEHVYEPSEDTFLMLDAVLQHADGLARARPALALELGSVPAPAPRSPPPPEGNRLCRPGTGVGTVYAQQTLAERGHGTMFSFAVDLNRHACEFTARTAANCKASYGTVRGPVGQRGR